jgi:hypothetical protein
MAREEHESSKQWKSDHRRDPLYIESIREQSIVGVTGLQNQHHENKVLLGLPAYKTSITGTKYCRGYRLTKPASRRHAPDVSFCPTLRSYLHRMKGMADDLRALSETVTDRQLVHNLL